MKKEIQLRVTPQVAATHSLLLRTAAAEAGIQPSEVEALRVRRRSYDARQRHVFVNLTVELYIGEPAPQLDYEETRYPDVSAGKAVVVVGAGPGGLFAALRLIEYGLRPIVVERGKDVHARRRDIALISRRQLVDPESNYAFGEGGAGAYSDGKLYTRSTKRGNVSKILNVFCQHGADTAILVDAHPHIGSDRLPAVIEAMRNTIRRSGGEVHFETRATGLLLDAERRVCGIETADGREFHGPVILATGHSARDVYRFLHRQGIAEEAKGIAVGLRLEHSSHLIDCIMYHSREGRGRYLPAAEYRMSAQVEGRGVYSFCMCPGGLVIPAASGERQVVVNGMSPSLRNTRWSNSGMVVELRTDDLAEASVSQFMTRAMADASFAQTHSDYNSPDTPLRMMYLQEALEQECWRQGGETQHAPSQRMTDFIDGSPSQSLPASSYTAGTTPSRIDAWLPSFLSSRLRQGLRLFGSRYRGFLTSEASLLAVETRTSSPVRLTRDPHTLQHLTTAGLFPCGEGAGYAGGIVSAAIDGERCADAVASYLGGE